MAAVGCSIAQNLFIAKKNILIEGSADLILLQHMGALLATFLKNPRRTLCFAGSDLYNLLIPRETAKITVAESILRA